ncbi:MAG: protein kinase [Rhodopseudomonas sp.]|nr:protein kinase [Rhodopseudomonas sp.]
MRFLSPGKVLRQYKILKVLGSGGFGITYLVRDETLDKLFAIKEYFPDDFASRRGGTIKPETASVEDFAWAKQLFLEEARILARFDHPNIVKVVQIFEANNTAYMVQDYESGRDLKVWLEEIADAPTQDELDCIVEPLLVALKLIHRNELLHRDVAPDNIYIRDDGTPVLLDFGSAKDALAQRTKNISAVVKPGYSPPELYSSRGRNQGPWSDNYSLAATLYFLITGERPQEATERLLTDQLVPVAATAAAGHYRPAFLDAIDWALKLSPQDRPQTIEDWAAALFAQGVPASVDLSAPSGGTKADSRKSAPVTPAARKIEPLEAGIAEVVDAVAKSAHSKSAETIAETAATAAAAGASLPAAPVSLVVPPVKRSAGFRTALLLLAALVPLIIGIGLWGHAGGGDPPPRTVRETSPVSSLTPAEVQLRSEKQAFYAATGNQALLEQYLDTCQICAYKAEAQKAVAVIKRDLAAVVEQTAYRAAQGHGGLLKRYLRDCSLCQYQTAAQDELARLDLAEYHAARGSVERLRAYVKDCNSCGSLDAAKADIVALLTAISGQMGGQGGPSVPVNYWSANGSVIQAVPYDKDPGRRTYNYQIPSADQRSQGVQPGSLFFEGRRVDKEYKGVAYQYSSRCGRLQYPVAGTISEDERSVSLTGAAPVPDVNCNVAYYENRQLVLVYHDKEDNWGRPIK